MDVASPQPPIGTCHMAGFYMSACCRHEVYLSMGQANPNCPGCGNSAEWSVTLRSGGDPRRHRRQSEGNEALYAAIAAVDGDRVANVRILNYSARGMAIELPRPAPISSEVRLYVDGFSAPLDGVIRHCTTRDTTYVVGIEIPREWNHELLPKRIDEAIGA